MSKALGQFVSGGGGGGGVNIRGISAKERVSRGWHLCDNEHKIIFFGRLATNNKHSFLRLYKMPKQLVILTFI